MDTLISDPWPQNWEGAHFCCFKAPTSQPFAPVATGDASAQGGLDLRVAGSPQPC